MFWADKIAQQIKDTRTDTSQHVDDMKTPSGRIHVGSLRGVMVHDLVYKSLLNSKINTEYTYVFNDMDPMDGLPSYLDESVYNQYMGWPVCKIPAPDGKSSSLAQQYADDFISAMQKIGANPTIIWSHELYQSGKMNDVIKEALDHVSGIRHIYHEVAGYEKGESWYPFQVICPQCGKLGSTEVVAWDGQKVKFRCRPDLVTWAKGCGYEGEISPFNGTGKLMWKVDWPAHWKVIGVTVEGAGKDHSSEGGSRDMAKRLVKEVFNYSEPFDIPYEWFLIGGRKMSSSKGVGTSASEFVSILPPEIGRFLFVRTNFNKQMDFDPQGMTIPDLFDEYDRCAQVYFEKGTADDFGRIYQASQIKETGEWQHSYFAPRFLEVAKVLQNPALNAVTYFSDKKGSELTSFEKQVLNERINYAKIWLEKYAPADLKTEVQQQVPESAKDLSDLQKQLLQKISSYLQSETPTEEVLQNFIYQTGKALGLKPKEIFATIYLTFLGKTSGPKAGALILSLNKEFVIKRIQEVQ